MPELLSSDQAGSYPIRIAGNALTLHAGIVAASCCRGRRAVVVTDENVAALYYQSLRQTLEAAGFEVASAVIRPGEASKTMATALLLYEAFATAGLSREDLVIALGGGVVGDLAGFAAATYLRGIPLMQVPTTLLAQVDSSIGGKNGVDLPYGKNLVGTVYQPQAVVIDPLVLRSLNRRRFSEGLAEIIKTGLISDAELFRQIEQKTYDLEWVIDRCVRIKAGIVARDEQDHGERMLLNFGHTIGHAIELVTGFSKYAHGEAVAIGMMAAIAVGEKIGCTPAGIRERTVAVLETNGLPLRAPELKAEDLLGAVKADKKKRSDRINFVLLRELGVGFVQPMPLTEFNQVFQEVWPNV
ncbi:MAG: 3-dehydroquinate synthase [Saccharofermentanales bacterium]|jgi:3-dehydroquinate synthase